MTKFLFLDAARTAGNICIAKELNKVHQSLYRETAGNILLDVSPHIFSLSEDSEFSNWYFENGWGKSWGLVIIAKMSFEDCWIHFRRFLIIKTDDKRELYFRFYDPRVLKIFLPTCDKNQILEFFGPVESFICEGDTKEEAIRFWHQNGELKQEVLPVEKIFGNIVIPATDNLS
ncbi:MAG: DUF4123 domain-containing protein [Ferruginibacter sp.]